MPIKRLAAVAALVCAMPVHAEDLALILSNQDFRSQPDLRSGPASDRLEAALDDAGFAVIRIQDQSLSVTTDRLAAARTRIDRAEHLIIVLNGHIVSGHGEAWFLSPRAAEPSDLTVGALALPLWPLFDMAAAHPGEAIVAVARQTRDAITDPSLVSGFEPGTVPQGVTLLTGGANALATAIGEGVLEPGRAWSDVLTENPDVRAGGFLPLSASFLPPMVSAGDGGAEPLAQPEPLPSREELMTKAEADLGLTAEDRRRVQRSLVILGFDPRGIDGVIGPGSRAAIRGWQADRRYESTGYLDRPQLRQLWDEGDRRAAELEAEARRRQEEQDARDAAYWRETGEGKDEAGLRAYLEHYPDGLFAETASARLEAIEAARRPPVSEREEQDWRDARATDTSQAYRAYLGGWPEGAYRDEAERRLAELRTQEGTEAQRREWAGEERRVAGNAVTRKLVENRLTALGLEPGPVDGEFDSDTRRALRRFQEARGLEVTGYVNQETMVRILFGN